MTDPLHTELLELAGEAARRAGELLRDGRPADLAVAATKSSPIDVVTEMDIAAEKLITGLISEQRPDDGFLGEEGASGEGSSGIRWVIDPLDGTVNYLYGLPTWAVSIAAEQDGETVAGVVAIPMRGETYRAVHGGGAWATGAWEGERRIACRPAAPLEQALVSTGFNYVTEVRAHQADVAQRLIPLLRDIRRSGSAAVDLCDVAVGRLDGLLRARSAPLGPRGGRPDRPGGGRPDRWTPRRGALTRADGRRYPRRLRAPPAAPGGLRRLARLSAGHRVRPGSGPASRAGTRRGPGAGFAGAPPSYGRPDQAVVIPNQAVVIPTCTPCSAARRRRSSSSPCSTSTRKSSPSLRARVRSDSVALMRCRSPAVNASMLRPLVLGRGSVARGCAGWEGAITSP
ncbi:fructose-1,6-bisphosphatase/inositol monophosphatase family enzyme [Streptomyces phaeoluteigriseus]